MEKVNGKHITTIEGLNALYINMFLAGLLEDSAFVNLNLQEIESYPKYTKYSEIRLFKSTQVPNIKAIVIEKAPKSMEAFGVKGLGENSSITMAATI